MGGKCSPMGSVASSPYVLPVDHCRCMDARDLTRTTQVIGLLGTPTAARWPGVEALPDFHKIAIPECLPSQLEASMPHASAALLRLLRRMLRCAKRRCGEWRVNREGSLANTHASRHGRLRSHQVRAGKSPHRTRSSGARVAPRVPPLRPRHPPATCPRRTNAAAAAGALRRSCRRRRRRRRCGCCAGHRFGLGG